MISYDDSCLMKASANKPKRTMTQNTRVLKLSVIKDEFNLPCFGCTWYCTVSRTSTDR